MNHDAPPPPALDPAQSPAAPSPAPAAGNRPRQPAATWWLAACLLLLAVALTIRLTGPSDLDDNDQPGPMAHILDVAVNQHWLMQHDPMGNLASKPPVYPLLGALGLWITGRPGELTFKLPLLAAFLLNTLLVFDLARRHWQSCLPLLGPAGDGPARGQTDALHPLAVGAVAALFWAANYHCFKLMFTARTDMLVTALVVLGFWSVYGQQQQWRQGRRSSGVLIAIFWAAFAGAALTKGPPALLSLIYLLGALWAQRARRAHRLCRGGWQLLGALLALGAPVAWLIAVQKVHPEYGQIFHFEVVQRLTGKNHERPESASPLVIAGYFLARFAPWSVLVLVGALMVLIARIRRWRSTAAGQAADSGPSLATLLCPSALAWTALVLLFFAIPHIKRADYILPSYVGAAIAAAALVAIAHGKIGQAGPAARLLVHLLLGATALACLAAGAAALFHRGPEPWQIQWAQTPLLADHGAHRLGPILCGLLAVSAAGAALWQTHRRRYLPAACLAAAAVIATLGVYNFCWSKPARQRRGDMITAIAAAAQILARQEGRPIACYEIGETPVQALLGDNYRQDDSALARVAQGGVLVAGAQALERWQAAGGPAAAGLALQEVARTPYMPEGSAALVLLQVRPLAPLPPLPLPVPPATDTGRSDPIAR